MKRFLILFCLAFSVSCMYAADRYSVKETPTLTKQPTNFNQTAKTGVLYCSWKLQLSSGSARIQLCLCGWFGIMDL